MIGVWLFLPLVAAGMLAVSAAARAAGEEAARLGRELKAFAELAVAAAEVGDELGRTHRGVTGLRSRPLGGSSSRSLQGGPRQ